MTITIGGTTYPTRKPKDLDAALIATTGVNAAETARLLGDYPQPGRIAAAVRPFLADDAPSVLELAASIGADGPEVLAAARGLYRNIDAAPEPETPPQPIPQKTEVQQ